MATKSLALASLTADFMAIEAEYLKQLEMLKVKVDTFPLQHVDGRQFHAIMLDLESNAARLGRMIGAGVTECRDDFTTGQRKHVRAVIASDKRSLALTQALLGHMRDLRAGPFGSIVSTR
jgi:hypothetical protein